MIHEARPRGGASKRGNDRACGRAAAALGTQGGRTGGTHWGAPHREGGRMMGREGMGWDGRGGEGGEQSREEKS